MIIITVLTITVISYFHYNQLPIYNIKLGIKFLISQEQKEDFKTIATKLGFKPWDKLLIIHADDLGLCKSVNYATFESFENQSISSASVMLTTDEILDVADFSKKNKNYDFGVHLTVTSEWKYHKWGGVLDNTNIKSLLNSEKHFY